jgi:hypothetical protein
VKYKDLAYNAGFMHVIPEHRRIFNAPARNYDMLRIHYNTFIRKRWQDDYSECKNKHDPKRDSPGF